MFKNKMNALFALFLLLSILTVYACDTACDDTVCPPNSSCEQGFCECDEGYVEDTDGNCVPESSDFEGTWNVTESCNTGDYTYQVTAEDSSGFVIWTNIYELGERTTCELSSDGTTCTIIPNQTLNTLDVTGSCSLNSNGSADFHYTLRNPMNAVADSCNMVLMK